MGRGSVIIEIIVRPPPGTTVEQAHHDLPLQAQEGMASIVQERVAAVPNVEKVLAPGQTMEDLEVSAAPVKVKKRPPMQKAEEKCRFIGPEEEERLKLAEKEEANREAQEEARRQAEEAAKLKAQEDEARRKAAEEEARLKAQHEEECRKAKEEEEAKQKGNR